VRVAVVGAGLYGSVAAVDLARAGHEVTLIDQHEAILHGASRANQGRIHRGFHYPRSSDTTREAQQAAPRFEERFAEAVNPLTRNYYAVASEGSRTDVRSYRQHLMTELLRHEEIPADGLCHGVDLLVLARDERMVDLNELRGVLRADLAEAGVRLRLGTSAGPGELGRFDEVVWATYGREDRRRLQWEVVEVVVVRLRHGLRNVSLVVMDGDFCSIDPIPGGEFHMLYDVRWSVRASNLGAEPEVPLELANLVDAGPVATRRTARTEITRSVARFLPDARDAEYQFSMFTVRAVMPFLGGSDSRPWSVGRMPWGVVVFPGKLASCIPAAERVVELCAPRLSATKTSGGAR
jgi:hypothetical protein